jgi:hypothetical protein
MTQDTKIILQAMNKKFEAVDRKFEQVDARFEMLDRKIEKEIEDLAIMTANSIDRLESRINALVASNHIL